ncbi:hypothetical protein [Sorangium sp. So ce542]|uniref:hypothetical protein n=1 Tax=Sorangium sp. So ce542 TaxID=3133316 RepID=UPI003F5DC752
MIGDFEARLAVVLGSRLPAPFVGRVQVEPGGDGEPPQVLLGVRQVELVEPGMGDPREAVVPGATAPRRVVHARCRVQLRVVPASELGRAQEIEGLDAAIYALDGDDFRSGRALAAEGDPGFLVRSMKISAGVTPFTPAAGQGSSSLALALDADGMFWPRGVVGQAGRAIASVVVRGAILPIEIEPAEPRPVAGGPDVPLTIRVRVPAGSSLPFGSIAVALVAPDGGPSAATLIGGADGDAGVRLLQLVEGIAAVTFRPPAAPASVDLIVALDHDGRRLGVELGRFTLKVRAS